MKILNFLWYCLSCMLNCFPAMFGHTEGLTTKRALVGMATFTVIALIILIITLITRKKPR